jgi:hypothetical protein
MASCIVRDVTNIRWHVALLKHCMTPRALSTKHGANYAVCSPNQHPPTPTRSALCAHCLLRSATSAADPVAAADGPVCVVPRSFVSSASAIRRAEAAEARRQQLLQRLQRLTGTANTPGPLSPLSAAAAGGRASSVCGSTGSRLAGSVCPGGGCGGLQAATAAGR